MKKESVSPLLGQILKKIAPRIGARVVLEPVWQIVGQIVFKSGRKRYFRYSSIDINTLGASEIAKDKDYANFFMEKMGYPTVQGRTFFSNSWAKAISSKEDISAAYRYAQKLGFPVIVKPNSGSQGAGVSKVHTQKEFFRALRHIFKTDRVALVQVPLSGKDYRIVVLDNQVISAYERIPLNVVGDGKSTILALLNKKQKVFRASSRDTVIKSNDPRIKEKLAHQELTFASVLKKNQKVFLLDNANLSTGGDSLDVTESIHPEFVRLAVKLTKDMGLRLCGVDIMTEESIEKAPVEGRYWILEINSAPGLDHYVKNGKAQEKIVEDMYLKVLKSMEL